MRRGPGVIGLLIGFGTGLAIMVGQGSANAQSINDGSKAPAKDHLDRLQNYRTRILDPQARPEERRNWGDALVQETLQVQSEQAKALVIELLNPSGSGEPARAVCEAIQSRTGSLNHRLDPAFVPPLVELLGSPNTELRSACSKALAEFPGSEVPRLLADVVRNPENSTPKRLAALDALAANVYRRDVVEQFIGLLESGTPEIVTRVYAALEAAAGETLGQDSEQWRAWWARQSKLSEAAWLTDRVRMYRERARGVAAELESSRERSKRHSTELAAKLRDFQRDVFRALPPDQRDARLVEWLNDPQEEVKLTAIAIIKGRIADEGKRPDGEVLAASLRLLKEGTPLIRREVLSLVQNLSEPAVTKAVMALLEEERDSATREAGFRAIGRLLCVEALPILLKEITSPDAPSACVREAALSLGQIAGQPEVRLRLHDAVSPLLQRYQAAPPEDVPLRSGLLAAMAGIADPSFSDSFVAAVDSDNAELVRPAILGLAALSDTSKLPRLRRHTSHSMPLVRLEAVEAIGKLGREDADLECVVPRINPATETNELVRDAAWRAFRSILAKKPMRERTRAAALLRDVPDREIEYLSALTEELIGVKSGAADLDLVRERLASVLVRQGKFTEAVPHLRELYAAGGTGHDPLRLELGLRLLDATLRSPGYASAASLVRQLAESAESNEYATAGIIATVAQYFDEREMTADPARCRAVLEELRRVPLGLLGREWTALMQTTADRLEAIPPPQAPPSSP